MTRIDINTGKKIGKLPDYSVLQYDAINGADYDNRKPNIDVCCGGGVAPDPDNPVLPYTLLKQGKTFVALVNDKQELGPLSTGRTSNAAPFSTIECGCLFWFGLTRPTAQPMPSLSGLTVKMTLTPGIGAPAVTKLFPLYSYITPTWVENNAMLSLTTDWFCFATKVTANFYDLLQGGAVFTNQLVGPAGSYPIAFQTTQILNNDWANVTNGPFSSDIGKNILRTGFPDKYPTLAQEPAFYSLKTNYYGLSVNTAPLSNNVGTKVWWSGQPLDPPNLPLFYAAWALNPIALGNTFACGILTYLTGGVNFSAAFRDEWWNALNFDPANQPRLHLP